MISPFRGDVVVVGFLLAVPVFLLGMRGDLTAQEVVDRLLWCLAAGWAVVAVVRFASMPPAPRPDARRQDAALTDDSEADEEPAPTA